MLASASPRRPHATPVWRPASPIVGATVFEARRRRSRGGLSRQPRFDHAVPGPHRRGTPCVHGWRHCSPAPTPSSASQRRMGAGGLHLPRGPYPEGRRAFRRGVRCATSRLHRAKRRALELAAGPAPAFPGADLHGFNETAYAIAREHLVMPADVRHQPRERDDVLNASVMATSERSCRREYSTKSRHP